MSLFGFGTPTELTTHIGVMVKSATDSLRIGPDWTMNVQICDEINRNRRDYSEQAVRAIKRRMNDSDQQTVFLALILFETCMKNCGTDFAAVVDKSVMDDMVKVAQGSKGIKNSEEALRLIATWARVFEHRRSSFPLFFDTFMHMKSRGITFPKEDENAVLSYEGFERPNSSRGSRETPSAAAGSITASYGGRDAPAGASMASTSASSVANNAQVEDEFLKLQLDLSVVMEKVNLCREILQVSPGIQHDEALADVIGFLEACRDRMVDVIEAGTQGLLGEELFAVALKVNDAVLRTLEAERTGTKIAVGEEDQPTAKDNKSENLLDLSPATTPKHADPAPAVKPKPVNDQFTEDLFAPAPPVATATTAAADFDPFGHHAPATVSAPTVVPSTAPSHNPFDDIPAPAPASASMPVHPPAAPVPAVTNDDFAILMGSSAKPAPASVVSPPPAASSIASSSAAQEFDDFLASLEKKN